MIKFFIKLCIVSSKLWHMQKKLVACLSSYCFCHVDPGEPRVLPLREVACSTVMAQLATSVATNTMLSSSREDQFPTLCVNLDQCLLVAECVLILHFGCVSGTM
jgi:hypothetical protein